MVRIAHFSMKSARSLLVPAIAGIAIGIPAVVSADTLQIIFNDTDAVRFSIQRDVLERHMGYC